MATLKITVSHKASGRRIAQQSYKLSRELAQALIAVLETMIADLPGQPHVTRLTRPDGSTVVEIDLDRAAPPPQTQPNFEHLFRERRKLHNEPPTNPPTPPAGP